jgi:cytochrome c-type biogenesis protein CcmF
VAVFVAGVTVVGGFQSERDVRMSIGDHTEVGGYRFQLEQLGQAQGPNYLALVATLAVTRDGERVATLRPQRRHYTVSRMPMTEVAIDRGFTRDLYVALGEPVGAESFSVRIHHKPLVNWIWGGCLLMALGGLMAIADRRYRVRRESIARHAVPEAAVPSLQPLPTLQARPQEQAP